MSLPDRFYLLTFAVRGHRLVSFPTTEAHIPRHPPDEKHDRRRYLSPAERHLVAAEFHTRTQLCDGILLGIAVYPTHFFAVIRLPHLKSLYGFTDAIRLTVTRRLQCECHWPPNESAFTTRVGCQDLDEPLATSIAAMLSNHS